MNPIIPPMAVAINVMPNDILAANPIAGANRVLTVEANNTERNFHIIITHVRRFELVATVISSLSFRHFKPVTVVISSLSRNLRQPSAHGLLLVVDLFTKGECFRFAQVTTSLRSK